MDRLDTREAMSAIHLDDELDTPDMSMSSLKQQLTELRRQARLHDRESLAACLSLAISLASPKRAN